MTTKITEPFYTVATGNFRIGITLHGLFDDRESASKWAKNAFSIDCWVVLVINPPLE